MENICTFGTTLFLAHSNKVIVSPTLGFYGASFVWAKAERLIEAFSFSENGSAKSLPMEVPEHDEPE